MNDIGFLAERNYGESLGDPSLSAKLLFVEDQYVLRITKDREIFDIDEFEMSEFWNLLSKGPVDKLRTMGTLRLIFEEFATVVTGIDYLRLIQISSEGAGDRIAIERVRSRFPLATVAA